MQDDNLGKIQIIVRLFGTSVEGLNEDDVHNFTASSVRKICELLFGKIKYDKKVRFAHDGLEKSYSIIWNDDLYNSREEMIAHLATVAAEEIKKSNEVNEMLESSDYEKIILNFDKKSRNLARARFDLSAGFVIQVGDQSILVEPLAKRKDIYEDGDNWYSVDKVDEIDCNQNAFRCKCGKTPVFVKFPTEFRKEIFDAGCDGSSLKLRIKVQKEVLASDSKSINGELMDLKVFQQGEIEIF